MRFIGTKPHGLLDYIVGVLLMTGPWIFDFNRGGVETWVCVILGAGALIYSFFTDYEMGVSRLLSMRTHLVLDLFNGILLAASPWIFGFDDYVWKPHLAIGIFEILAAVTTKQSPAQERHRRQTTY